MYNILSIYLRNRVSKYRLVFVQCSLPPESLLLFDSPKEEGDSISHHVHNGVLYFRHKSQLKSKVYIYIIQNRVA